MGQRARLMSSHVPGLLKEAIWRSYNGRKAKAVPAEMRTHEAMQLTRGCAQGDY